MDALQEFTVTRNIFPAEFGRTTGGVVNMTSKSGTNMYHGAAQREIILYSLALNSLQLRDGKQAASLLERCLKEFPHSARRPDVLLAMGKAYVLDEKNDEVMKALKSVIADFPQSAAASQARELLKAR